MEAGDRSSRSKYSTAPPSRLEALLLLLLQWICSSKDVTITARESVSSGDAAQAEAAVAAAAAAAAAVEEEAEAGTALVTNVSKGSESLQRGQNRTNDRLKHALFEFHPRVHPAIYYPILILVTRTRFC